MTPRPKSNLSESARLLTETELEIMRILWRIEMGSVHDVLAQLPQGRELAYTSVSTILRILEQKGFVNSRKEGRGHIYLPSVGKQNYEAKSIHHLVENVFDGAPSAMVKRLLESEGITQQELDSIRELLSSEKNSKSGR